MAVALNELAALIGDDVERTDEAVELIRRAIEIDRSAYGDRHAEVAVDLSNLARILHRQKRYQEAEAPLREALEIDEAQQPRNETVIARRNKSLGILMGNLGRVAEARDFYARALEAARAGDIASEVEEIESLMTRLSAREIAGEIDRELLAKKAKLYMEGMKLASEAKIKVESGDLDGGYEAYMQAIEVFKHGDWESWFMALDEAAAVKMQSGDFATVHLLRKQQFDLCSRLQDQEPGLRVSVLFRWAEADFFARKPLLALVKLRGAFDLAESYGYEEEVAVIGAQYAPMLAEFGDPYLRHVLPRALAAARSVAREDLVEKLAGVSEKGFPSETKRRKIPVRLRWKLRDEVWEATSSAVPRVAETGADGPELLHRMHGIVLRTLAAMEGHTVPLVLTATFEIEVGNP